MLFPLEREARLGGRRRQLLAGLRGRGRLAYGAPASRGKGVDTDGWAHPRRRALAAPFRIRASLRGRMARIARFGGSERAPQGSLASGPFSGTGAPRYVRNRPKTGLQPVDRKGSAGRRDSSLSWRDRRSEDGGSSATGDGGWRGYGVERIEEGSAGRDRLARVGNGRRGCDGWRFRRS